MFTLNCKGKLILIEKPLVMGILNINNDSFYSGSRFQNRDAIVMKAEQMIEEGADIIDIGGQSTRPESERITAEEEMQRVLPVIEMLEKKLNNALLSIDTYHPLVAEAAVKAGASIVNDISAGEMDKNMLNTVASLEVPYICMHMKGVPETMHLTIHYENILQEVVDFFINKINECRLAGIKDVIIDPGFGFGKTIQHNFFLLKKLSIFKMLGRPIMAGLSRKSIIYKTLHTTAENALNGSTVLNTIALQNGASILRVHDVKEAREAAILIEAYGKA
ncbi:dihydropteroate synthase [Ginsengibacter hankyongi]|uniref:dihydropteroate synthase n=1 Tax=Ginsengibacter hankyongi TaxID=2607284 RepID=A0A5J5IE14_9BACT|nr:dihydropteroate synthase [Ginsengibacter hankyongi]KAA9034643.1 dihydropteroate synthase [Ginsengibacter hankyongi]